MANRARSMSMTERDFGEYSCFPPALALFVFYLLSSVQSATLSDVIRDVWILAQLGLLVLLCIGLLLAIIGLARAKTRTRRYVAIVGLIFNLLLMIPGALVVRALLSVTLGS